MNKINYKYSEDRILAEIKEYVDKTYNQHYAKNSETQTTEFIIDKGHGTGFCIGNILKYATRYKTKGSDEDARLDLLKVVHYAIVQLHIHDKQSRL